MKKTLLFIVVILVLAAALGTGSMIVVDNEISKAINRLNDDVAAPVTVNIMSDQNSFFARSLILHIDIETADEPTYVVLRNDIQKRPWGTSIEHELTLSAPLIDMIDNKPFADFLTRNFIVSPIIAGNTEVSMIGTYHANLASFSVNESLQGADIFFAPMSVSIQGNIRGNLAVNSDWDGMHLVNHKSSSEHFDINWQPTALIAEGKYYGGSTFVGSQVLTGNGFMIVSESSFNPINVQVGSYEFNSFSDVENGLLTMDTRFSADSVSYQSQNKIWPLTELVLQTNLSGLDIENLAALTRELNALGEAQVLEPSPILTRTVNKLLQDGFRFTLPEISAKLEGKPATGSFTASLPANSFADISNLFSLIGLIPTVNAQADMTIAKEIVEMPAFAEPLSGLINMGALILEGDRYVLSAEFINGAGTLNGNPIPLPF